MTTPREAPDECVEGFKPMLYELQLVRQDTQETVAASMQPWQVVEGITLTVRELQEVATHYYGEINSIKFFWEWTGEYSGCESRRCAVFTERLSLIRTVLGQRRYEEAIAADKQEWDRKWDELEEEEKNLAPCKKCGGKRTIRDEANSSLGWCCKCENGFSEDDLEKWCNDIGMT